MKVELPGNHFLYKKLVLEKYCIHTISEIGVYIHTYVPMHTQQTKLIFTQYKQEWKTNKVS